jgi:hypothetical protein
MAANYSDPRTAPCFPCVVSCGLLPAQAYTYPHVRIQRIVGVVEGTPCFLFPTTANIRALSHSLCTAHTFSLLLYASHSNRLRLASAPGIPDVCMALMVCLTYKHRLIVQRQGGAMVEGEKPMSFFNPPFYRWFRNAEAFNILPVSRHPQVLKAFPACLVRFQRAPPASNLSNLNR